MIYVNMGESSKDTGNSFKNREGFYASGVDNLARFVDKHSTEIRVSLLCLHLFVLVISL